jgi:hypothetical protein
VRSTSTEYLGGVCIGSLPFFICYLCLDVLRRVAADDCLGLVFGPVGLWMIGRGIRKTS